MKSFSLIILSYFLISSCNKTQNILTKGDWKQYFITTNNGDTVGKIQRLKFRSDTIFYYKYNPLVIYKIKRDSIEFINAYNDSLRSKCKIIELTDKSIKFEGEDIRKDKNQKDSIVPFILLLEKIESLPDKPFDKVLYNLAKLYDIGSGEILGDGDIYFNFDCRNRNNFFEYDDPYKTEPKIKGIVDRAIGSLPKRETLEKYSRWQNAIMNSYEWETLDYKILMEDYYKESYNNKNYLEVKIWITEK